MPDPSELAIPPGGAPATPPVTPPAGGTPPVTPPAGAPPVTPPADPPVGFDPPTPPAPPVAPQDNVVVYEKTGDTGLDVALRYVGERGFGPDHPAVQAATKGDFAALEQALGALGEKAKGFKEYVDLAKDSYGRRQAATKSKGEAVAKAVYDSVGGKEQWAAIQAWAAENADANEKAELNAAFKAGGVAATAAATFLKGLYDKNAPKGGPKAAVKADAAGTGTGTTTALNPREFAKEVFDLSAKLGTKMESSPEYAQLVARRRAFRAA